MQGPLYLPRVEVNDLGNGAGHTLCLSSGRYIGIGAHGAVDVVPQAVGFSIFSVTYNTSAEGKVGARCCST